MLLIPTILCGGAGSRLWPLSREMHPKPFIRLSDGQSLLQKAFLRGVGLADVHQVLTVTNREFFFKIEDELRQVNDGGCFASFILEPVAKNTAAAIAAAAFYVTEKNADAIMLILPADHLITDQAAFAAAVEQAKALAQNGKLVTFGIKPNAPETGFGYIETNGNEVLRFVEKPDLVKAQAYLESGRFLWNSGMFCFKASIVIKEMQQHCPQLLKAVQESMAKSDITLGNYSAICGLDSNKFAAVPADSFDCAVMEKSKQLAVVPCDIGWSDVGTWSTLGALLEKDDKGNCIEGEAILHDVSNCHIQSSDRIIGAVGVSNLVIIDTPDALLVANKDSSQDVKHLYAELKKSGHATHRIHRTAHRPWGTYTVLEEGPGFKIKRIVVDPGASLSLQMHHHRSEHWVVVSGKAKVIVGDEELFIDTNQSTYIAAGQRHRMMNPGIVPLVMIEVQSGEYLSEDDIVRFDDHYGRDIAA